MASLKASLGASRDRIKEAGGESVQLVIDYVKQETVDPIKALGRFVTWGAAGSFLMGLGIMFLIVSGLRCLQEETTAFHGNLSWLPYLIMAIVATGVIALVASRISASPLTKRQPIEPAAPKDQRGGL